MSRALNLYRLQQVDSKRDHAIARLQTIHATLENDAALREAKNQLAAAEAGYASSQRELKQIDHQVQDLRIKIEQTESSLYSGRITNPKELQDLQKDAASLKKHLQTLEERELESMIADEAALAERDHAKQTLADTEQKVRAIFAELTGEQTRLQKEVEKLDTERTAIMAGIDPSILPEYDQLRQRKRGTAVAAIADSACAVCGASITAAQTQAAQSATRFEYCSSCGRILYAH